MEILKRVGKSFIGIMILIFALSLYYYLPKTEIVHVVGTEVKWIDKKGNEKLAKDVRYIFTKDAKTNKASVFRNEDMPWPPYFKFDSGDLSGQAMALEKTQPLPTALVTYYGWRIQLFSLYPNAVAIEAVEAGYQHIPWFNIIFLSALLILLGWMWWKIKNWHRHKAS
ncbi:MAG: DUF1523 family protein [Bdellovibrionales bacterium]|nr:DUF1523 family protein [Bdellovibrionales bacterium]